MRDALGRNPSVLVNLVAQSRQHERTANTAFVFVEGSGDRNVYSVFSSEKATFTVAHCRDNVGACLRLLQKKGIAGVLGIEDSDCDRLLGIKPDALVCTTDGHDLEAMILQSGALEKVLSELGDSDRVQQFEEGGRSVREALLDAARPLGIAKYLKAQGRLKGLNISSKDLAYERFIDASTVRVDVERFCGYMSERCDGRVGPDEISQEIQAVELDGTGEWDICRGHDLVGVLTVALSSAFGTKRLPHFVVEQDLRLAFDSLAFARTGLCAGMVDWESSQTGFTVLHDDVKAVATALREK